MVDTAEDTGLETVEPSEEPIEEEDIDLPVAGEETPSEDYCTEFSNFDEWTFFGDGNWYVDGGILYENRGGYYASVAYMYDFGNTNAFELYVDTGWQGNLNDLAGFVFNLDPSMRPIGWFESTIHKVTMGDTTQRDALRWQPAIQTGAGLLRTMTVPICMCLPMKPLSRGDSRFKVRMSTSFGMVKRSFLKL